MAEKTKQYGRHEIVLNEEGPELAIDGTEIAVSDSDGTYWTPERPYEQYLSLEEIAKTLIDDDPEVW
ncbi:MULTISPECIES: hypothetical protein [Haloarcula]|uniref:Uncharacterized protein n=1 Tax=Haloarcula pellucida TaxID=1427151 RepID=A0A830GMH0_9EURY|nr:MULTISPECIES: hypothetical protein [Halomicroarcula]MBX0349924.1 hypothetical protein [Halomicroarcula pellucida]MDS0279672.1 hypothetical protein [Halomicroarcula sp. S1AR25-4]QIO24725.1 hypothetical protein G9465_20540 [Haloarcula sp. JP-L23]GGN95015.1 hypothetical protein GCM10009030_22000 [Halomicroarcula pellucida]